MSWASSTLTLVETAIANLMSGGGNRSYSIDGKSFTKESLSALTDFRARLQSEIAEENSQSGNFTLAELNGQPGHRRFEL